MLKNINKIDKKLSADIYKLVNNNKILQNIPYFLGLLPYEIYVIPGMFLAILQTIWLNSSNPIQFHLLPHWFAYSLFQFLKKDINRGRPGCVDKSVSEYIDESHCKGNHIFESFPSGHTGVCFSLATALFMEMMYSEDPKFFEIRIESKNTRRLIACAGYFVATFVSIQRISKGYHHLGDCIIGALLGSIIGFISWTSINIYKKRYYNSCKYKTDKKKYCKDYKREMDENPFKDMIYQFKKNIYDKEGDLRMSNILLRTFLSIAVLFLTYIFFSKTVWKLTSVKH